MGLIEIVEISDAEIRRLRASPGDSVVVKGIGLGGSTREATLYQQHGFRSRPIDGTRGIFVPLGSGSREGIVIATENYTLDITLDAGGAAIYSTDASGAVQALIKLRADGTVEINGDTKRLGTHAELASALATFVGLLNTALGTKLDGAGTPGALTLDISASQTTTLKTGG